MHARKDDIIGAVAIVHDQGTARLIFIVDTGELYLIRVNLVDWGVESLAFMLNNHGI